MYPFNIQKWFSQAKIGPREKTGNISIVRVQFVIKIICLPVASIVMIMVSLVFAMYTLYIGCNENQTFAK